MAKIPVSRTIAYGYSFTFGHLGTIIGLIWLPMVIVAVAGYFTMSQYYGAFPAALDQGDPAAMGQSALIVIVWSIASLLLWSMMYAAVTRQALGLRKGPAFIDFSFGATELRVFGAMAALVAIFAFFMFVYLLVIGTASELALSLPSVLGKEIASLAAGILTILFLIGTVYSVVRLSFLLVPATVAEGKIGLAHGWQLAKGNFWRIVAIGLATLLPMIAAVFVAEIVIIGPEFFTAKNAAPTDLNAQMQQMAAQMRAMAPHLPLLYGFLFFIAPVALGLSLAPPAFAYRALTEKDSAP